MATLRLGFFGDAISKQTNTTVLLPQEAEGGGPYPVLYLLHGLSDDDTTWTRCTSIERYTAGMPLIVVMPDGGRGYYTDAQCGPAYERHILEDVIGLVDRFCPTIANRDGRAIGGLSMGGYGAMKIGLKYPDRFCSVVSHSSVFDIERILGDPKRADEQLRLIFGDDPAQGDNDVFRLAEQIDRGLLPALRFDCGTDDALLEHSRAFHRHLEGLGIPHEYEEFPGAHEWGYWDTHIQEALEFHAAALRV
ncbi:MAG: alpha/beta hydrolase [Planctomycetota bacterium]|jgi:S-formylglutathione hydrolase FrmB